MREGETEYGIQAPWQITRGEFWEFLEMMWPEQWTGCNTTAESFHFCERCSGDIVMIFVRLGKTEETSTFWRMQDREGLSHTARVNKAKAAAEELAA